MQKGIRSLDLIFQFTKVEMASLVSVQQKNDMDEGFKVLFLNNRCLGYFFPEIDFLWYKWIIIDVIKHKSTSVLVNCLDCLDILVIFLFCNVD